MILLTERLCLAGRQHFFAASLVPPGLYQVATWLEGQPPAIERDNRSAYVGHDDVRALERAYADRDAWRLRLGPGGDF